MTRYLVLTDVHANMDALEAVLAEAPSHDAVICLGDTVGYGARPNECVERIASLPNLTCLVGNHDLAALHLVDLELFNDYARAAAEWTGRQLSPDNRAWLQSRHSTGSVDGIFLAHASPRDPVWEYMEVAAQGPPNFEKFAVRLCLVGHTHVPRVFYQAQGKRRTSVTRPTPGTIIGSKGAARFIINPGGVGQPRDRDPRAAYGLFDSNVGEFRFWRAPYNIARAQADIRAAGLPESLAARLEYGV